MNHYNFFFLPNWISSNHILDRPAKKKEKEKKKENSNRFNIYIIIIKTKK